MSLFQRRRPAPETPLSLLFSEQRDTMQPGQLVRALARSVVHVPLPGEQDVSGTRVESVGDGEGPPLYVLEDEDGKHALVYTTPQRLAAAWGRIPGATVDFSSLMLGWPEGVDLVIDAGHPEAMEVGPELLRHTAMEIAGIPTGTSVQPSPGAQLRLPPTEPVQVLGVTREVAESVPGVAALWRAEMLSPEAPPRPVLTVVFELVDGLDEAERAAVASTLSRAIEQSDPNPVLMLPTRPGATSEHQELIDAVRQLDAPYWQRTP